MAYIYKITNKLNQKAYIGKTEKINPEDRWREHLKDRLKPRYQHRAIYKALNKYGPQNFTFEVIEETDSPNEREEYFIQFYNTFHFGYNETLGGDGVSYLELPEQDIIKSYLETKSIRAVARLFNHDVETIKKVLYKNNIALFDLGAAIIKSVAQIDKDTDEIIQIFPSVAEAEKATGNSKHISSVCQGKRKTAQGYKWKYTIDL